MRYRMDYTLIKRKLPSGKVVYYYAIYDDDGKRIYRSTGEKSKALADKYVRSLIEEGRLGVIDRSMIKLKDFAADFFIHGKCPIEAYTHARGKSLTKASLYSRRVSLVEHILPHLGNYPVYTITTARINKWLIELPSTDNISRTTSNATLVTLKLVMEEAVRRGLISENPCHKVDTLGSDSKRRNSFTIEEVKAIIGKEEDWKNPMIRTMCLIAALTGMRIGEVRALKPEYVTKDEIIVKASFSNEDGYKSPKNGKERIVPIPELLYDEIMKFYPGEGNYFFRLYKDDKPMSSNWVSKSLNQRMEELGIAGKTFHSFRAFFNTQMISANVKGDVVRQVIGHASEDMTARYLHLESAEFPYFREAQLDITNRITIG